MKIEQLLKEKKGTVVDVRTTVEFSEGHVPGSINIPLQELNNRIEEVKSLNGPLLLCCASGGRSGQAYMHLSSQGIDCHNVGSWLDVEYLIAQ